MYYVTNIITSNDVIKHMLCNILFFLVLYVYRTIYKQEFKILHKIKYRIKSCMKTNNKGRIFVMEIIASISHSVHVCVITS